jgi:hypothetical protein
MITSFRKVRVTANDYAYDGWLLALVEKRSGAQRAIVEDSHGRVFIHNPAQIAFEEKED